MKALRAILRFVWRALCFVGRCIRWTYWFLTVPFFWTIIAMGFGLQLWLLATGREEWAEFAKIFEPFVSRNALIIILLPTLGCLLCLVIPFGLQLIRDIQRWRAVQDQE